MKKVLLIFICIIMLVGCKKKQNTNNNTDNQGSKPEIVYYTKEEAQERLNEIAEEIYQNKSYLSYTKEYGRYFISLKELRNTLKYDTSKIDNIEGLKCDENETGVIIDIDDINHNDYYGAPIKTSMLCNPPSTDNNQTEEQ